MKTFLCPECGSSYFGTYTCQKGFRVRHCNGPTFSVEEIKKMRERYLSGEIFKIESCKFKFDMKYDDLYFYTTTIEEYMAECDRKEENANA